MEKVQLPSFSIVIPSLDEEKYLPNLLEDLSDQSFKNFEVILVDGNSDDDTVKKAKEFSQKLDLSIIISKKRNVGHQRNLGAKRAKSNWLIFMDADNRLPKTFLSELGKQLKKRKTIDAFSCWMKVDEYPTIHKPTVRFINFSFSLLNSEAMGAMIGIKKNVFSQFEFAVDQVYEDADLIKKLIKSGYKFKYLQNPSYVYSLRRFEKEGTLKLASIAIEGRIRVLLNKSVKDYAKYPMLGGSYYEITQSLNLTKQMEKIENYFKKATKKQVEKAKKIWSILIEDDLNKDN